MSGDVRFKEARIGRADIRVPVSGSGSWRLPPDLVSGSGRSREWAIESLNVGQLLVTTQSADTGRTNQAFAENVHIEGQRLIGPWRVEGSTSGVPFRLVTGELTEDKRFRSSYRAAVTSIPVSTSMPGLLSMRSAAARPCRPCHGKAKVLFGPPAQIAAAGIPIPITVETDFKTQAGAVALSSVSVEAGEGGASLRMTGEGSIGLDVPRIALKLEGRRLDADSFILSSNGQDFKSRLQAWSLPPISVPIDLDLRLDSIGLGQEDLTNANLRLTLERGKARLERIEFNAPGETRVGLEGELGLTTQGGIAGQGGARLQRIGPAGALSQPHQHPLAFPLGAQRARGRNLVRYRLQQSDPFFEPDAPEARGCRHHRQCRATPRRKATSAASSKRRWRSRNSISISCPTCPAFSRPPQNVDVRFHSRSAGRQRRQKPADRADLARVLSDGPALLVEALDIVDLAGANARVSGRIAPDGSGRSPARSRPSAQRPSSISSEASGSAACPSSFRISCGKARSMCRWRPNASPRRPAPPRFACAPRPREWPQAAPSMAASIPWMGARRTST